MHAIGADMDAGDASKKTQPADQPTGLTALRGIDGFQPEPAGFEGALSAGSADGQLRSKSPEAKRWSGARHGVALFALRRRCRSR